MKNYIKKICCIFTEMKTTSPKYNNLQCAEYLLALANDKGKILNQTKLQKLLFIAYGEWLCQNDGEVLFNETAKLWPFGPVFPTIKNKIDLGRIYKVSELPYNDLKNDIQLTELFNKVLDKYGDYSAGQLSGWSHSKGSPWAIKFKEVGNKWNTEIDNQLIQQYFCEVDV